MEATSVLKRGIRAGAGVTRWLVGLVGLLAVSAHAVTINVIDPKTKAAPEAGADGQPFGFRYTIEEDGTYNVVPGQTGIPGTPGSGDPTLSLGFHRSHMKVVKVGHANGASVSVPNWTPEPGKRYYVTVMPDNKSFGASTPSGYTMNGAPILSDTTVTVPVNRLPYNTAQISVFVFEDNGPINGAADSPGGDGERPLCGFELQLFEAGGAYGASGGRVNYDTFGNPLGTEYAGLTPAGEPNVTKLGSGLVFADRNGVARIKNLSPAKYTIFSVAPREKPDAKRCSALDANGNPTTTPIWVQTAAQLSADPAIRAQQMVWDMTIDAAGNRYENEPAPYDGDFTKWHQTTTIEGTWGVDAWVKSGEPTFFKEFGPPGHHVWHGWVRRFKDRTALSGAGVVRGTVVNTHMSRPPGIQFKSGAPMTACWIGINEVTGNGLGRALYADACNADGSFRVAGLIPGNRYQLAVWDEPLDNVMANYEFVAPADGSVLNLRDVPVFSWFSNLQGKVFYDAQGDAFPFTAGGNAKPGIPNTTINIRFRDGSIYNSTVTDDEGNYEFAEVFPFFNWMVAELDFTRFKARGATIIPDNGGDVVDPTALAMPSGLWPDGTMAPQIDPLTNRPYRIFGGLDPSGLPAAPSSANLLQAFQGFLGQTNVIHWAMSDYNPADKNDHGGITGVVHYASTRAENDPRFTAAENNEPGIPSVEIRLYKLDSQNMVVSPTRGTIAPSLANEQDAVQVVVSDDWNKAEPAGCVDPNPYKDRSGNTFTDKCYDGMRIWNQVRDGVFDGGWAFVDYCPSGAQVVRNSSNDYEGTTCADGSDPVALPPGRYMTEGVAPYGYEHQKEEDKNVDFGDLLSPGTLSNPAMCMGSRSEGVTYDDNGNPVPIPLEVPEFLTMFPDVEIPARYRDQPGAPRPYCNKKLVVLAPGMNPFSDFFMFTKAPVSGHIVGMILDDLANEFDPYAPSFGEKYAPPFMPISIRDYAGNEINRVYSDRYGTYNAVVPSTFAFNVPMPSGVAPNMVNVCLNSPTMKDPVTGATVVDPHYNPQYTQYCYTFQYLPGKTTYLDTPVLPIAAFAGPSQYGLDAEQPDGTPGIKMAGTVASAAATSLDGGPWVPTTGNRLVRIQSMGKVNVPNPAYDKSAYDDNPNPAQVPKTIERNFGFGTAQGTVRLVPAGGGTPVALDVQSWADDAVTVSIPASIDTSAEGGTIEVVKSDGRKSVRGVTLHVGTTNMPSGAPIYVGATRSFQTIQSAIDAPSTRDGDLIIVDPGVYEEAPILWKRVRVQGYGAPSTIVNASMGAEYVRQAAWRARVCDLIMNPQPINGQPSRTMQAALVGSQTVPADLNACLTGDTVDNAPLLFGTEEASGFFVLAKPCATVGGNQSCGNSAYNAAATPFGSTNSSTPRALQIDGFTVTGADTGGGIVANGNAIQLQISNNIIKGNQGIYNGGIRIGHADMSAVVNDLEQPVNTNNPLVNIHHNEIVMNGNTAGDTAGGGGGISIYTGARGYRVANNYIAGNYSTGDGGGMAHFGTSGPINCGNSFPQDNRSGSNCVSTVSNNQFRFNQSFSQAKSAQGGGLAVVGIYDNNQDNGVTFGTGSMAIVNNVFQGNLAGAGDGGGIALVGVNGSLDVTNRNRNSWNRVDILGNVITNNGAGVAGGGISLQDAGNVHIVNNTVSMNDSFA
ncbi:MAG: hypothetical protein AB7F38_11660, partial [Piscinibacter sp.]